MIPGDKDRFAVLLKSSMAIYNQDLAPAAVGIWWACMERYEFDDLRDALSRHIQDAERGQFVPKPADVIRRLQANDGWIGQEEAWALMSPALNDEGVTVVATQEMLTAFGVALSLQDDAVAARMVFREKYTALLAQARSEARAPKWMPSLGTDTHGREGPLREAERLGRLPSHQVAGLLPNPAKTLPAVLSLVTIK